MAFPPTKTLLFAGLAVGLAGSPLRAQEQPVVAPDANSQTDQAAQNALLQQVLRLATEAMTEAQPSSATGATASSPNDQTMQNPMVRQLVQLAMQEIREVQRQLAQSEADDSGVSKGASTIPADLPASTAAAAPSASSHRDSDPYSAFAHAWDSSLSTGGLRSGGLRTGGLQTGGLRTGSLQTGNLSSGHLPSSVMMSPAAPRQGSVAPAAAAMSVPPADPDDEMRRWSQGIDRQYPSEQAARSAAVRQYPDLAVSNSAFNARFLARYAQYRQADPFGFLRGVGWPMKLAIFTAGDLQRQQSGLAVAP